MPKIVVSLRSVLLYERSMFCTIEHQNKEKNIIEYLQTSLFSLGKSL